MSLNLIVKAINRALNHPDDEKIKEQYLQVKQIISGHKNADLSTALKDLEETPQDNDKLEELEDELVLSGARQDKSLQSQALILLEMIDPSQAATLTGTQGTKLGGDTARLRPPDNDELVIGPGL